MLRKRSRPFQKDQSRSQLMADLASDSCFSSDSVVHKARGSPFFTVPGLFVGFTAKATDSDSAKSPTSPLEYKIFTNLGNSVRSPRSPGLDGSPRSWDCERVGLSLVDSLNDEPKPCMKVLRTSQSRNILFGSQLRIHNPPPKSIFDSIRDDHVSGSSPKSLPKNYGISSQTRINSPKFSIEYESSSTDLSPFPKNRSNSKLFSSELSLAPNLSGSLPITIGNGKGLIGSLSASDIELSEDYTCIISHGPNPKTTHIFGDCILDGDTIRSLDCKNSKSGAAALPSDDFLSYCFTCKKKLEQGEDIYMYRGEKAFCSCNCRDQEIMVEEELEKPATDSSADFLGSSSNEEIFVSGMALAS